MNTVCQGFAKDKEIAFQPKSGWSLHGKARPYTPFLTEKFPTGQVLRKSLRAREITM